MYLNQNAGPIVLTVGPIIQTPELCTFDECLKRLLVGSNMRGLMRGKYCTVETRFIDIKEYCSPFLHWIHLLLPEAL